jgi:hypothetical protein
MEQTVHIPVVAELRRALSASKALARGRTVLPLGIWEIDQHLSGGGLALSTLHEMAGGGNGAIDGAAARDFVSRSSLMMARQAKTHAPRVVGARALRHKESLRMQPPEWLWRKLSERKIGSVASVAGERW